MERSFSSPTGLAEVYQISSYDKAAAFAQAVEAHKRALANLHTPDDLPALPAPTADADSDHGNDELSHEPAFFANPRENLAVDWVLLAILVISLALGIRWTVQNRQRLTASPQPPTTVATPSAAPSTQLTSAPKKAASSHVKKVRHHKIKRHRAE